MAITASMGHQSTLSIGGTSMAYVSETLSKKQSHVERPGIRGTRQHYTDDVVGGVNTVDGTIVLEPSNAELTALLAYIVGPGLATNETLPDFTVIVGRDQAVFTYSNCKVDVARFSGRQGENLRLSLDVVGKTGAQTGTAPTAPASGQPFIFSDIALTLAASVREVSDFELTISNALVRDRYMHHRDVTEIPEGDRTVMLRTTHPYSSNTSDLHNQAVAGAAGSLALSGAGTRTFTFHRLQVPAEDPTVQNKGEVPLTLNMQARGNSTVAEITIS